MKKLMYTVAAALVFVSGAAFAQQQGQQPSQQRQQQQKQQHQQQGQAKQGQQGQQAQRAYEATKHFAVVNAGIQDAKLNAKMLSEISKDSRSYDQQHGDLFVKNIRESLQEAQTHLQHLQPLATSDQERKQFTEISKDLQSATQMVQPMAGWTNDPKRISDAAGKLEKELDKTMNPLKQMASSMNAKIEIG